MLVRTGALVPEEEGVLASLASVAARAGVELVTVLIGTAAYDAERAPAPVGPGPGVVWVLEEDHDGRGIRPPSEGALRSVSSDELVEALLSAEKVISFS